MYKNRFLSPEQVDEFWSQGYLVVRKLLDDSELEDVIRWTDEIENLPEVPGRYMMYFEKSLDGKDRRLLSRVENFIPYHEGFARLMKGDKMAGAVSDLFGEPAVLFKDKINYKLAGADGYKPHQDVQAGWDDYAPVFITAMVAVDETNEKNGSLQIAGGWHDKGLIGKHWEPLGPEVTSQMEFTTIHAQPGDAIFFDSWVPHGSLPNRSDSARRVLYITYNKSSDGDHREQYYYDKRQSYPPDIEREPEKDYSYKV